MRRQLPPLPGDARPCQCGSGCGLTIERIPENRNRRYHKKCPAIEEKRRLQSIAYQRERYRRMRYRRMNASGPRPCKCGCGTMFVRPASQRRLLYAPDCPTKEQRKLALGRKPTKGVGKLCCAGCANLPWRRDTAIVNGSLACAVCRKPFAVDKPLDVLDFMRKDPDG